MAMRHDEANPVGDAAPGLRLRVHGLRKGGVEALLEEPAEKHLRELLVGLNRVAEHLAEGVGPRVLVEEAGVVSRPGVGARVDEKVRDVAAIEPLTLVTED